jgi:hypothetical protein
MKEVREDLYTQAAYSKVIGKTPARVNQLIKEGALKTVQIKGAVLIKAS